MSDVAKITEPDDEIPIEGTGFEDQAPSVFGHEVISGPLPSPPKIMLTCLRFFAAGIGKVGIRNNCSECRKAVVMWNQGVGIRRYRVNGNNQIIIQVAAQHGELIGEDPC